MIYEINVTQTCKQRLAVKRAKNAVKWLYCL